MLKFVLLAVLFASLALTIIPACVLARDEVDAEILEAPQNQYILEGTNATITCRVNGDDAFWNVDGTLLSSGHHREQSRYEALGVVFIYDYPGTMSIINLTMIVPACASSAVKNIKCVARDQVHRQIMSDVVDIFVLKTFRPHSPTFLVDVTYRPSMPPEVTAIVTGHPLWNGYEITEYRVNVTNGSDGSLLDQITVPNDANRNNSVSMNVNQSLFESTTQNCYSLIFSGSAVSSLYDGVSESTQFQAAMFRAPGTFSDEAVDHSVLFNSDGTLSHVSVQVQLPDVCDHQPVNYMIIVEKSIGNRTTEVLRSGPHHHEGPGIVSQDITNGLEKNNTYFVKVLVDTVAGSVESNSYPFSTAAEFDSPSYWSFNEGTSATGDVSVYVMAMGIAIGVAVVTVTAFGILLVCLCACCQRMKVGDNSRSRVYNSMVPNPIYAGPVYTGPVYDVVQPQFESISKNSPSQTLAVSPQPPDMIDRDEEHTHLTTIKSKPLSSNNIYATPGDVMSPTTNTRVLMKNGPEKNKLQLTLPLGGQDHGCQRRTVKAEETYVEMSTTGTLKSQSSYSQDTPV